MAGLINELINTLTEMADVADGLISLGRVKRDVIIKNNVTALKGVTAKENVLVGKFQKLDRRRASATSDIAIVLNINASGLTLKMLGEIIREQDEYGAFSEASTKLTDKLGELREQNDLNRVLVENALDYIDFSVNVLRSTIREDDSFMDDKRRLGDGKGFLDTRN